MYRPFRAGGSAYICRQDRCCGVCIRNGPQVRPRAHHSLKMSSLTPASCSASSDSPLYASPIATYREEGRSGPPRGVRMGHACPLCIKRHTVHKEACWHNVRMGSTRGSYDYTTPLLWLSPLVQADFQVVAHRLAIPQRGPECALALSCVEGGGMWCSETNSG
jgi:hypothetical protein